MEQWKTFFENKYPKIGRVLHLAIERGTPIPGPCGKEEEQKPKSGPPVEKRPKDDL